MITSPGPTALGLLINKELNKNIPSIRRNPILANIFARMKFMDRRGSGFDKIINGTNRLFNDNENHVEFYATTTHFSVVIYNANYDNEKSGVINGTINDTINDAPNETLVYIMMKENPQITIAEIVKKEKIPKRTVDRIIAILKDKKIIDREGSNKSGYWKVNKQ